MSEARKPPMQESDEANGEQLDLARKQGETYVKALKHMVEREASAGGEQRAGEYVIAFAIEKAEGMYFYREGKLEWTEPDQENAHIEISVRDAADDRFIPGLQVDVALIDENGEEIGSHRHRFLWHPWLYHYGRNWVVPANGTYSLRVRIEPPEFMRHDPVNGQRFTQAVETVFKEVEIKTGRKAE